MEKIKKTCLHDKHTELGATMSPFGGFDMPIQYEGIIEEHNAVRNACGVFDVSHMGEITVVGPDAEKFVNYIFTNDVRTLVDGECMYGMMLHPHGGTVDDLLVYRRRKDDFLLVVNASNVEKDFRWVEKNADGFEVVVSNLSEECGELAVQGPYAEAVLRDVLGIDCSDLKFYTFKEISHNDERVLISRTGYTGEDGFEIYASRPMTRIFWEDLIKSDRCKPCGLGCRDTLRFEVGLPLYGDELDDDISPLEASLGMFVKTDKESFIGRDAIMKQKEEGVKRKLVGLEIKDRAIARHGTEVLDKDDNVIGVVTTGYRGISTDRSIATALVDPKFAVRDTELKVRVRRKVYPAVVVPRKFYKKSYKA